MADLSRRDMLRTGAASVVAGLAAAGCSQQAYVVGGEQVLIGRAGAAPIPVNPGEPLRTAFVGIGGRGRGLLNTWLKLERQQVVAVCDPNKENLDTAAGLVEKAQGKAPEAIGDGPDAFKRLLDRKDIHAIVTATPCFEHGRIFLDCIHAGKHIYGEKPLAITASEANAIQAAADANPKVAVQVGFQWMASPRFRECIERIHRGDLGELIEGRFFRHNGSAMRGWFSRREKSGDWMLEQACHEYNIMNWVADAPPLQAFGMGRRDLYREEEPDRNVTDYYATIIEYPKNFIVHYAHGWISPDMFREFGQKVIGRKAAIEVGGDHFTTLDKNYKLEPLKSPKGDDTQFALQAFLDSVHDGKPVAGPVKYGRNATILALMVRKAVDERRVVTWNEALRSS